MKIFNSGTLYKLKNKKAFIYTIQDKSTLIKVLYLINGKFRTPKIQYLYRAIDYMNEKHNVNIEKLPLDNSNILSNP